MRRQKNGFLFGLGLGIIITGIISLFLLLSQPNSIENESTLSEEDIIKEAKALGMIFASELPSKKQVLNDSEAIERAKELGMIMQEEKNKNSLGSGKISEEIVDTKEREPILEETDTIHITIPAGMKSYDIAALLYENQLIDDRDQFDDYLQNKQVSTILGTGTFSIPKNSTYDEIINILLRKSTK